MNRWLYSYRAVSGDPAGLAGRLRGDLHGLLAAGTASTPPAPAGDGSFRMHLAVQVLGAELTKAVRVTTGVATVHGTRLGRPADHLCVEQQQRGGAQHGALVGVLSEADLMEKEARPATDLGRGVTEAWRLRGAMTVGEACSRPAHVTAADATLRDAVRELIDHGVARLVVVDGSRIAGILTRHDVLAALIRTDEVVKHTVDAVLQRQDEPDVTAMVEWGVITLSGTAARRSRIPGLIAQVEAIDGVMGVDADRLGYRDDDGPARRDALRLMTSEPSAPLQKEVKMRNALPTPGDLFDTDPSVAVGPGDPRPGRAPQRSSALVIDPDAATRIRLAAELAADGYEVSTCPGPCTPTNCPARDRVRGQPCPRLPADLALVMVDQASARTRLLDAYASWAPGIRVEITGTLSR